MNTAAADHMAPGELDSGPPSALTVVSVTKSFGGVAALENFSIDVLRGEVHGLIGPNGAGKTTAVNVASGVYRADRGQVFLSGAEVTRLSVEKRARRGLGRTFQGSRIFPRLTVNETIRLVLAEAKRRSRWHPDPTRPTWSATQILDATGLEPRRDSVVAHLPYGDQKRLEAIRATVLGSAVIVLDEPTSGLGAEDAGMLLDFVLEHRGNSGILLIEHNLPLVLARCARITVLHEGRVLITDTPEVIVRDPAVLAAYLGNYGSDG